MKTLKYIIRNAFIGMGIGSLVNCLITIFFFPNSKSLGIPSFTQMFSSSSKASAVQLLIFASLGILQGAASRLFENERLSLLAASAIHYFLILLPLMVSGVYLHWFAIAWSSFVQFLLLASVIYCFIYLFFYLVHKKDIEEINKRLKQL
ncbi:DUF3021 domain-containing protein [Streptococcus ratti]|uniref:DUF3021 domain-containing protein n=2 Tax=Streptococcus ratti TaxID=1341 RepID=A0A7X9LEN8_STRRT|nr:DUF3021 domain-containing protein [Streptococcus ratti]VEI60941.1 Protein of uncharacterised function (DUF3021) [Streptococcus mutans]EJN94673.1 hypothetical protein SRA_09066 [Streptococcus ratti FA-1 = DSM 20564]EMP70225.1 hypothetical protein D822_05080 [Streptococcus ratti FA-1 = DSM 20564]NMD48470.1 DUF3021 domain-containing protein [Streptococcus ratti]QEY06593.1 DUF3021 domain-containing protein [Streptococcus ratti]